MKFSLFFKGEYLKAFWGVQIFSLIYLLSIIRADVYYIDDMGRPMIPPAWDSNGRPLTTWLLELISDGLPVIDASPIPQLIGVGVLSYCMLLFVRKFYPCFSAFSAFSAVACGYLNLFLLENVAYRYESVFLIALGVFFLLFAIDDNIGSKKMFTVSIATVIFSLSIYQATIGAYLGLIIIEIFYLNFYSYYPWKDIVHRFVLRVAAFGVGGIIYKFFIADNYVSDWYNERHSEFLNPFAADMYQTLYYNISVFVLGFKYYVHTMGALGILMLLFFIFGLIYVALEYVKAKNVTSNAKKIAIVIIFLLTPILITVANVLPLLLLKVPVFAARVLISFTVCTLYLGMIVNVLCKNFKFVKVMLVIPVLCTLSFSSLFGNLLDRQERMNSFIASTLIYDMHDIESKNDICLENVSFVGRSPKCKELDIIIKERPLFDILVPLTMQNDWGWGSVYLSHFRYGEVKNAWELDDKDYIMNAQPVKSNDFYKLYLRGDKLIINFFNDMQN